MDDFEITVTPSVTGLIALLAETSGTGVGGDSLTDRLAMAGYDPELLAAYAQGAFECTVRAILPALAPHRALAQREWRALRERCISARHALAGLSDSWAIPMCTALDAAIEGSRAADDALAADNAQRVLSGEDQLRDWIYGHATPEEGEALRAALMYGPVSVDRQTYRRLMEERVDLELPYRPAEFAHLLPEPSLSLTDPITAKVIRVWRQRGWSLAWSIDGEKQRVPVPVVTLPGEPDDQRVPTEVPLRLRISATWPRLASLLVTVQSRAEKAWSDRDHELGAVPTPAEVLDVADALMTRMALGALESALRPDAVAPAEADELANDIAAIHRARTFLGDCAESSCEPTLLERLDPVDARLWAYEDALRILPVEVLEEIDPHWRPGLMRCWSMGPRAVGEAFGVAEDSGAAAPASHEARSLGFALAPGADTLEEIEVLASDAPESSRGSPVGVSTEGSWLPGWVLAHRRGASPDELDALLPPPGTALGVGTDRLELGQLFALRVSDHINGQGVLDSNFRADAVVAIRNAWRAAATVCERLTNRAFVAPHWLKHRVSLERGRGLVVDGPSLGLAAFLAFVSHWTRQRLPPDCIYTSQLTAGGKLGAVGKIKAKVEAAQYLMTDLHPKLLISDRQHFAEAGPEADAVLWACATLDDALDAVGLAHAVRALRSQTPPATNELLDEAESALDSMERQRVGVASAPGRTGDQSPATWAEHADTFDWSMRTLRQRAALPPGDKRKLDARQRERFARLVASGPIVSLAYHYAGLDDAIPPEYRPSVDALAGAGVSLRARVWGGIVGLAGCFFGDAWQRADDWAVHLTEWDAALGRSEAERGAWEQLHGMVKGTLGRLAVHRQDLPNRDYAAAAEWLREAVAHHQVSLPHEAPRSMCYLINCLRLAGDLQGAMAELARAAALVCDLEEEHPSYMHSTRMFLQYEAARLHLDRGDLDAARSALDESMGIGDELAWHRSGPWRVAAQIARRSGDTEGHKAWLDRLKGVVGPEPEGLNRRLLHEAEYGCPAEGDLPEAF